MAYFNYSISRKRAQFYEKQKTPTEGYEEITYGTENKKTYHKYYKWVQGYPAFFGVKEVQYEGRTLRFLELALKEGEDIHKISVPLKNKGGYTEETRALLSALNGADLKQRISFTLRLNKYKKKNGGEGESLSVYGNYIDDKNEDGLPKSTGYILYEDIPKPTSKTVAGDVVWDFTEQTEFYYNKINEISERFIDQLGTDTEHGSTEHSSEGSFTAVPTAEAKKEVTVTIDDDLPF